MKNALAALVFGLLAACATEAPGTEGEGETSAADTRSDYAGGFPSPSIVREGATLHAYVAKQDIDGAVVNVAHVTSEGDGHWTFTGDALPKLGKQADQTSAHYAVWAPSVAKVGNGQWVLHYSATLAGTAEKKCLFRATAATAAGPFVDTMGEPLWCQPGSLWSIDPYLVQDETGAWNVAARIDEPGGINTIQIRKLDKAATNFAAGSSWAKLVENSATSWEQPVLENAGVVRLAPKGGSPHWMVFYSGRAWSDDSYAVGYADCGANIAGPCTKKTATAPWLETDKDTKLFGPGTPTFYVDETGATMMSVQTWRHSGGRGNDKNAGQDMWTYALTVGSNYAPAAKLARVDQGNSTP